MIWFILALNVGLNTLAQVLLKVGVSKIHWGQGSIFHMLSHAHLVITSPFIIGGAACFGFSLVLWLIILSRADLGFAAPLLSLNLLLTTLTGVIFFAEPMYWQRWVGIVLILGGTYMISQTPYKG